MSVSLDAQRDLNSLMSTSLLCAFGPQVPSPSQTWGVIWVKSEQIIFYFRPSLLKSEGMRFTNSATI